MQVKLYFDEKVPEAIAAAVRLRGHDVTTVRDAKKKAASDLDQLRAGRINPAVIGKALVYFEDAEADPESRYLIKKIDWKSVKKYFVDHVRQFTLDLQGNV